MCNGQAGFLKRITHIYNLPYRNNAAGIEISTPEKQYRPTPGKHLESGIIIAGSHCIESGQAGSIGKGLSGLTSGI
jgi:hypothetical protein